MSFRSRRNDRAFLFLDGRAQRRVYYRCIEARRKRARKRGYWHNSGIFLEILRRHRYSRVCALSIRFAVFSRREIGATYFVFCGPFGNCEMVSSRLRVVTSDVERFRYNELRLDALRSFTASCAFVYLNLNPYAAPCARQT